MTDDYDDTRQTLIEKLLVHGNVYETPGRLWVASVLNAPAPGSQLTPYPDMVLFDMEFKGTGEAASEVRTLRLWTSHDRLMNDPDYPALLRERLLMWLTVSRAVSGEIWFFND